MWCCYDETKIITIDRHPISPPHGWGMGPNRSWWRHQLEIFSALLAFCAGNSLVNGEFPAQRSVTWSFDLFFGLRMNKWLSKQWKCWWFEMPSRLLWRHCNGRSTSLHCSIQWHVTLDLVITASMCTCNNSAKSIFFTDFFHIHSILDYSMELIFCSNLYLGFKSKQYTF